MSAPKLKLAVVVGVASILSGIAAPAGPAPLRVDGNLADATASITGIENGGQFGHLVENGGDLTGDGIADLVVGAWLEADEAGRVYVFEGGPSLAGDLSVDEAYATFQVRSEARGRIVPERGVRSETLTVTATPISS